VTAGKAASSLDSFSHQVRDFFTQLPQYKSQENWAPSSAEEQTPQQQAQKVLYQPITRAVQAILSNGFTIVDGKNQLT